jgi:hypothetical protein
MRVLNFPPLCAEGLVAPAAPTGTAAAAIVRAARFSASGRRSSASALHGQITAGKSLAPSGPVWTPSTRMLGPALASYQFAIVARGMVFRSSSISRFTSSCQLRATRSLTRMTTGTPLSGGKVGPPRRGATAAAR